MEEKPFICLISDDFVENHGQFKDNELSRFRIVREFDKLLLEAKNGEPSLNSLSYIQKHFPQKSNLILSIGFLYDKFSKKEGENATYRHHVDRTLDPRLRKTHSNSVNSTQSASSQYNTSYRNESIKLIGETDKSFHSYLSNGVKHYGEIQKHQKLNHGSIQKKRWTHNDYKRKSDRHFYRRNSIDELVRSTRKLITTKGVEFELSDSDEDILSEPVISQPNSEIAEKVVDISTMPNNVQNNEEKDEIIWDDDPIEIAPKIVLIYPNDPDIEIIEAPKVPIEIPVQIEVKNTLSPEIFTATTCNLSSDSAASDLSPSGNSITSERSSISVDSGYEDEYNEYRSFHYVPPDSEWITKFIKNFDIQKTGEIYQYVEQQKDGQYVNHNSPMKIIPIKADGNCGFRALSQALTGTQENHLQIRKLIILQFDKENPRKEILMDGAENALDVTRWCDDSCIEMAAKLFEINIVVYKFIQTKKESCYHPIVFNEKMESEIMEDRRTIVIRNLADHFDFINEFYDGEKF